MNYSFLSRTKILFLFILAFALILVGKLFLMQIVHKNFYTEQADHQYATPSSNIFERGTIFFSRKDGVLVSGATQASGYKIAINPTKITNVESVYNELSTVVTLNRDEFFAKNSKSNDIYEEVLHRVTKEQADQIIAMKIGGVSLFKEKWRFYPGGDMAANSIGLVGYKGNDLGGRYGLERLYNEVLSRDENNPYINFFAEVFSSLKEKLTEGNKEKAGDLVTTIEPVVQDFLSKKISEVQARYNADAMGAIIMDPKDGSIYALDTKPSFNPNDFSQIKDTKIFANSLVEDTFEFGSVVKPLVMAAGLDTGVVTANTKYNDKGFVIVANKKINNFDKKGRGPGTTMQDVLNQSLNTGMVFVAEKLGHKNEKDYLLSYGINEKTGIDLPNETSGLVSNLTKTNRDLEYDNAAFGQGIALTPIEMTRALASLSNGGNLVTPHLVKSIKYDDGTEKILTYPTKRTKITPATSEEITRMLVTVMDKSLKGGNAKFEHFSVAVKTGTAQVANRETGGYYEDRHTHSFFGYFPAYDPKFIVFLYAVNPKGVPYASQTWADPFLDITKFLLNYYEVPPDR